jgi:hypothetical protein
MDVPPHGSLSPAPSAHELLDNKPKLIEAAICWALLELFHLRPIVSCKKKGDKIMFEFRSSSSEIQQMNHFQKKKTKSLQLITNTASTCPQA